MPEVRSANGPVVIGSRNGHPIDCEGEMVALPYLRVEASVVLSLGSFGWAHGGEQCEVGNAIEAITHAGRVGGAAIGGILLAQAAGERRSDIEALRGGLAIHIFSEADVSAGALN